MHIKIKKVIATISAMTMLITTTSLNSITTVTAQEDIYAASGECGENANWLINSDGTLVVYGNGEMSTSGNWGWKKYQDNINEVIVENGITGAVSLLPPFGNPNCYNFTKITFPPSYNNIEYSLYTNPSHYTNLKDIYVYSKSVTSVSYLYHPNANLYTGSGIIWHVYKGSQTETSLRNDLHLTDEDIEYIPNEEVMPTVTNKNPVKLEPLTDKSGPSGLFSKWEWDESSNTLTFSGKGDINYDTFNEYKKFANKTKHIVIKSGIASLYVLYRSPEGGAFYGFTDLVDIRLPESLLSIGDYSFYQTPITQITLPEGVEILGASAFKDSKLEEISFPKSLNTIGESAFAGTNIKSINLHSGMSIGGSAFNGCQSLKEVIIPKNVHFAKTLEGGQGMPRAHSTFSNCTGLENLIIQEGVTMLGDAMFQNCSSLKKIFVYSKDLYSISSSTLPPCEQLILYLYKDSTTETTLRNAGYLTDINVVYLATDDDINKLKEAIEQSETFDKSKFTEDYTKKFTDAVSSGKAIIEKYNNDKYSGITLDEVNKSLNVLENPEYIPSSYTSVDEAIAKADKLDLSKYTDESVKTLQEAINAVEKNLDITDQDKVDAFAKAIEDAIKGLVEKKPNTSNNNSNKPNQTVSPTNNKKTNPSTNKVTVPKPAKVKSVKLTAKKKKLNVKWKKVSGATGYEVMYAKNNKFTKGKKTIKVKKNKITLKRLKSKKKYFVKVRAYKTINGNTSYGKWSKVVKKKAK